MKGLAMKSFIPASIQRFRLSTKALAVMARIRVVWRLGSSRICRVASAVKVGHLHVHQDDRVIGLAGLSDGFKTVLCRIHFQADVFKHKLRDFEVYQLVIGDQNAATGMSDR